MASENILCIHCLNHQADLNEKEKEIKKLKIQIQNLTNYLLWQDQNIENVSVEDAKLKLDLNQINKPEKLFFSSNIFITSCNILSECTIFESKSVQTEEIGKFYDLYFAFLTVIFMLAFISTIRMAYIYNEIFVYILYAVSGLNFTDLFIYFSEYTIESSENHVEKDEVML